MIYKNAGEAKDKKTVTHGLVDVFQCSPDILNRARESQMVVYGKADSWEYTQKYTKLAQKNHICKLFDYFMSILIYLEDLFCVY